MSWTPGIVETYIKGIKGAIYITIQQKINGAMAASGKTQQEIASAFGISQQAFSQRLKTGKFTQEELEKIAGIMGCKYISCFQFPDGTQY